MSRLTWVPEIAYALNRQFGPEGLYRGLDLYTFADNHDVERVASLLKQPAHRYPLSMLLMTMPGLPSLSYGSEGGIEGRKRAPSDAPLRPALTPAVLPRRGRHGALYPAVKQLIARRRRYSARRRGAYTPRHVSHAQFAFCHKGEEGTVVVAVNAADRAVQVSLRLGEPSGSRLVDGLNGGEIVQIVDSECTLHLHPRWGRVLVLH